MKKILYTSITLLMITVQVFSQEEKNDRIQTIFNGPPEKISGFVGPIASSSIIDNEFAYFTGFEGALLLNNKFFIGGYRLDLQNDVTSELNNFDSYDIDYESKGLLIGYVFFPNRAIHFSVASHVGNAKIELYDDLLDSWISDNNVLEVNPHIELEFNLAKFCKIGVGANYRYTFDVDQFTGYDDMDFSGPGAFASIKFGWFY